MREYFNICESDFLASRLVRCGPKVILEDGKTALTFSKRDDENIYFARTDDCVINNERVTSSLIELTAFALKKAFRRFCVKKDDLIMVVGVGNEGLVADSLGARVVEEIVPIMSAKKRLCAFCPSVSGRTGIESFDIVKALVEKLKPKVVICVDTLASKSVDRLSKVIQIKDGGLTPGLGVGNQKTSFDYSTLGVNVIGIGVPLVIYAKNLLVDYFESVPQRIDVDLFNSLMGDLIVTSKEIDLFVGEYSKIIATVINRVAGGKNG